MNNFEAYDLQQWQRDGLVMHAAPRSALARKPYARGALATAGVIFSALIAAGDASTATVGTSSLPALATASAITRPAPPARSGPADSDFATPALWQSLMAKIQAWKPVPEFEGSSPDPQD